MKPSELRIGNWIYDDEGNMSVVIGMNPFDHSLRCDEEEGCDILIDIIHPLKGKLTEYYCSSRECSPVLLSHEILEKCGFEYDEVTYDKQECPVMLAKGLNKYSIFIHTLTYGVVTEIEYLHQLQNLIFSLTGEELNFKP